MMKWFIGEESGQGLVEYSLIIALVSVVLISSLQAMAVSIGNVFNKIAVTLNAAIH